MKNRKKAVIIIGVLLAIAIAMGFAVNIVNTALENKKIEDKYQEVIDLIDKKEYISAMTTADDITDYKDTSTLIDIADAFYAYETGNYSSVESYINKIPKTYNGKYKNDLDKINADAKEKVKEEETSTTTTTTTAKYNYDDFDFDDDDDDYVYTTKKKYYKWTTKRTKKYDDPYDAKDYANEEDFYDDHYDDFFSYEDAEDYYNEYGD